MKLTTTIATAILASIIGVAALPQATDPSINNADAENTDANHKKGVLVLYTDDGDGENFSSDSYWPGIVEARSTPGESTKFHPVAQVVRPDEDKSGQLERRSVSETAGPVIEVMPDKRTMWINKWWMMQHGPSPGGPGKREMPAMPAKLKLHPNGEYKADHDGKHEGGRKDAHHPH